METLLTNPQKKWVLSNSDKRLNNDSVVFVVYTIFFKDGRSNDYFVSDDKIYMEDISWSYSEDDSIFKLNKTTFKILRIKEDTILMKMEDGWRVQLINFNKFKNKHFIENQLSF